MRLALSFLALPGLACAATGTLTASTQVDAFCTVTTTALVFGAYDPIVGNKTQALNSGSGAVNVTCVKGSSAAISLGLGSFANGTTRRMRHATTTTEFLTYELYQPANATPNAACTFPGTTVWGSAGSNILSPTAAPNKNSRTFNVCGTVPAGQNVEVGSYADTVTASVSF